MPLLRYAVGGLSLLGGVLACGIGLLLASFFWASIAASDQRWGVVIAVFALGHLALPVSGILSWRKGRDRLGWVLCCLALLLAMPMLAFLPGAIEAAARP